MLSESSKVTSSVIPILSLGILIGVLLAHHSARHVSTLACCASAIALTFCFLSVTCSCVSRSSLTGIYLYKIARALVTISADSLIPISAGKLAKNSALAVSYPDSSAMPAPLPQNGTYKTDSWLSPPITPLISLKYFLTLIIEPISCAILWASALRMFKITSWLPILYVYFILRLFL